jgi:diguanylate cyclase (GGDEF)-like protein/PAS domain S-box-containing protein
MLQRKKSGMSCEREVDCHIVADTVCDAIVMIDENNTIIYANHSTEKIFGYRAEELHGRQIDMLLRHVPFEACKNDGSRDRQEMPAIHKDGRDMVVEISLGEMRQANQCLFTAILRDVTERKKSEILCRRQNHILEMIARGKPLPEVLEELVSTIEGQCPGMVGSVLLLDDDGMHVRHGAAPRLSPDYNRAVDGAAIGPRAGSCGTAMYTRKPVIVTDIMQDPLWADYRDLAQKSGLHACWSTPIFSSRGEVQGSFAMYYGEPRSPTPEELHLANMASHIAGIAIERKRTVDYISHMAHHDALTGLPNRVMLQARLHQALASARRRDSTVALLFIDLDNFKTINDSLGHHIGDYLLKSVAGRLQHCLREGDEVARLGGDEFVIVLTTPPNTSEAALVANKVLKVLETPFATEGHEFHIGGSIGISLYPTDGDTVEQLMQAADTAMYHAKEKGRGNYQFYTQGLNDAIQRRLVTERQLRQALARGELALHYQPQIDMQNGRIQGVEALLRWHHPERGPVLPEEFISIAEDTGLILAIGEWTLREACRQLKSWHVAGYPDLKISVNLSTRQTFQHGLLETVAQILKDTGLPANALNLEITESILMQPSEDNLAMLRQFGEMGIQLSVDDFGTGYSNLAYLQQFPIHALKIDRSFVRGIGHDRNNMVITDTIIAMARALNLDVVAEGVETEEQAAFLREHGCRSAQGFYFSRPLATDALVNLMCGNVQATSMKTVRLQP